MWVTALLRLLAPYMRYGLYVVAASGVFGLSMMLCTPLAQSWHREPVVPCFGLAFARLWHSFRDLLALLAIAVISDLCSLISLHLFMLYMAAARLYHAEIHVLGTLWKLFTGTCVMMIWGIVSLIGRSARGVW